MHKMRLTNTAVIKNTFYMKLFVNSQGKDYHIASVGTGKRATGNFKDCVFHGYSPWQLIYQEFITSRLLLVFAFQFLSRCEEDFTCLGIEVLFIKIKPSRKF